MTSERRKGEPRSPDIKVRALTILRSGSLTSRLILGFIALVILTAATIGAPALWLVRQQLVHLAWSQVEQGQRATRALYASRHNEIVHLATLTAQRPTLHSLLARPAEPALVDYLETLQAGAGLNFIAVCETGGAVIALTDASVPAEVCESQVGQEYFAAPASGSAGEEARRAWLIAAHPLAGGALPGNVIVGVEINQAFVEQLSAQTGLEQTFLLDGRLVASSFEAGRGAYLQVRDPPTPQPGAPAERDVIWHTQVCAAAESRAQRSEDCQPYYAARLPVSSQRTAGGPGMEAEVALKVDDAFASVAATQKRLVWILGGGIVGVALLGSLAGVLLARRFSQPLVDLAKTAEMFSSNIEAPVANSLASTEIREVALVAQALERARVDLERTLSDLRREMDWSSHLLESIVEGIVTLDQEQRITFFSHGAERITGWSREEVIHRSCDQVFRLVGTDTPFSRFIPLPGQQVQLLVEVAAERTECAERGDLSALRRQATLSFTGASLAPTEAGESRVVLVFRDVSQQEIIHRLLGHFLANIAHEFRTPLSALAASIELLLEQGAVFSPAEMEELLQSLHLGVLSLQTLVDNLLESASIEAGHFRVSPRPYGLGEIVTEAARTMQPLLEKYGQRLAVELPADPPLVQADPRRIVQVLVNLLSNASKYGPAALAEITVRAVVEDGWARLEVSDRGTGIPAELRKDLFRRYLYPAEADRGLKTGAGLGLSVVKAVVEAHGSQIHVDDRPGGGSTFWFTLPIAGETW